MKDSKITNEPDFKVQYHGSIYLLEPQTAGAKQWAEENIGQENGFQPYWPTVVIESRYANDVIGGLESDGYTWM